MQKLVLYAVGDVGISRHSPKALFDYTAPILRKADIAFCQNERVYTKRSGLLPQLGQVKPHGATWGSVAKPHDPKYASVLKDVGFGVVSCASNHSMELGADAMLDTIDTMRQLGLAVIGVGRNVEEARQPAIIERKGTRVAFLGYASVIRVGHEAATDRPGCAPLRVRTRYKQVDYQPGTPPKTLTYPNRDDVKAMKEDIKKAKAVADVVVISIHWGVHHIPAVIAMYERTIGHAAIDAGADLIIGHHAHILKGIDVYKGKVIFHNLGNFAFAAPYEVKLERMQDPDYKKFQEHYGLEPDPELGAYQFSTAARKSMIAKCTISGKKIERVSYIPVLINKQAQSVVLCGTDKSFREHLSYMEQITKSQGLKTRFEIDGDEIVVCINH